MSNFIIAGEAGSPDLADCEFLGKKLEANTPSTTVHIISKHVSEWHPFLKKLCNSYGFKEATSPIIFTVDGKLIGDKQAFKEHALRFYSVDGELDKNMRSLVSEYDKASLESRRQKQADGPSVKEQVIEKVASVVKNCGMQVLDGHFDTKFDRGFQFCVKLSQMLSPFTYDDFSGWGEDLEFVLIPEFMPPVEERVPTQHEIIVTEEAGFDQEEGFKNEEEVGSEVPDKDKEKSPSMQGSVLHTHDDELENTFVYFEVTDRNFKSFVEYFTNPQAKEESLMQVFQVEVPNVMKSVQIYESNILRDLGKDYLLALSPFPLIPQELVVFSGKKNESGWLIRDSSMMPNWLKLLSIPPQKPIYRDGDIVDLVLPKESLYIKDISGACIPQRGFTYKTLTLNLECPRDPILKLNNINMLIHHILTESDWEVWFKIIKELNAIGYYQMLPYGETNYQPLRSGQMLLSMLPIKGVSLTSFYELIENHEDSREVFALDELEFDHMVFKIPAKNVTTKMISDAYLSCIEKLNIAHKNIGMNYLDCGVNIVLSSQFLMVVPIYKPYACVFERNLYPDPLWYCGVMSIPVVPKKWPETVGELVNEGPFDLLERCSKYS